MPLPGSLSAMTTGGCPYTVMWMAYLGPPFCVSVFQIPTTLNLIGSILAVGTLFVKGSMPFVTTGLERIIG